MVQFCYLSAELHHVGRVRQLSVAHHLSTDFDQLLNG